MKQTVSNTKFFSVWKKICKENEERLLSLADYSTEYTSLILKSNKCIIDKIGEELELEPYPEYYQIDAVFFDKSDIMNEQSKHKT